MDYILKINVSFNSFLEGFSNIFAASQYMLHLALSSSFIINILPHTFLFMQLKTLLQITADIKDLQ